ncbi:2-amino-4-hydroxy-6-hydroxymethyldihydropteridine diphosphokinase [bacterium E08(2017)]|nr:2-amino-4-hydroxy-6-hydroxymethyldihydropteridine diphosphokinase [bacterium E08(2017)]
MEYGLSLGSNTGDRLSNLSQAVTFIRLLEDVTILQQSPVYESEPQGMADDFKDELFLNTVLIIESTQTPMQMLSEFQAIEENMGRPRNHGYNCPRTIDIDIIYAEDLSVDIPGLIIPHPRWSSRRFVVQPLADIRPDIIIPGSKSAVSEILKTLPDKPQIQLFDAPM